MFGAMQQVRRARARETFVVVPMIAGWHGVCAIEALHMADDLGDDASETIADGNHARAIEFRRLDVEQVVHAAIRELAFEDTFVELLRNELHVAVFNLVSTTHPAPRSRYCPWRS